MPANKIKDLNIRKSIILSIMSSKFSTNSIIGIVVAFILISVLLPIGLNAIAEMELPQGLDPSILTLLTTFLPIVAIIGIVLAFIPKLKNN